MELEKIKADVRSVTKKLFPGADIVRIEVVPDEDADGDPIYQITVVLAAIEPVLSEKLPGFVRHLRSGWIDDDRFPIVSFRSKADDRSAHAAAA